MIARRRSILVSLVAVSLAGALASCSAPAEPEPTSTQTEVASPPVASETPIPSPTASTAAETTCASILPADTVSSLEEVGWTAQESPFYAGGVELPGGLQCTWGDYSVATDHVQIYGWAPATDAQADTAQQELLSSGWRGEESADGLYVTESTDTAITTDDNGYGITYLFGDGWVTISDTKQGLVLIERPQS